MTSTMTPNTVTRRGMGITVALTAAIVGVVYGYDTGSIAGALLFVPAQFNLSTTATEWITTFTGLGLIVGALVANRIADRFGRKPAMVLIAIGFTIFAILQAVAQDIVWLDITRFFLGVSIGISTVAAPVFIAESAPVAIRGALIVGYQVATVAGIMVAYFADWALAGSASWRLMLGLSAIASGLVLIVLFKLPDTPRWYVMRGRRNEAIRTLRLVDPETDPEEAVREIEQDLGAERGGNLREMVRLPYARPTLFVLVLGFLVQITGINAVTYYSPFIFHDMGWSGHSVLLLQALIEVFSVAATVAAVLLVDRIGRRLTLMIGIGVMIASNALMVVLYALGGHFGGVRAVLGFLGILFFTAGFNFGFGAMVWVYASESFPARLRTAGAGRPNPGRPPRGNRNGVANR
ncbi:MAG: sugar porter family MFS transporter [Solirubrobacterales bacterium]|nr:sugar porter family MFS transporter [Solirubrobacterales bacterium]